MAIQDLLIFLVQRLPKSVKSDRVRLHTLEHLANEGFQPYVDCSLLLLCVPGLLPSVPLGCKRW